MSSMLCFFAYLLNDYRMALVLTCLLLSFLVQLCVGLCCVSLFGDLPIYLYLHLYMAEKALLPNPPPVHRLPWM